MKRAAVALALATALASALALAKPSLGDPEPHPHAPPPGPAAMARVAVEASPLFTSVTAAGTVVPAGWNEILVRVQNKGTEPLRGEIRVADRQVVGSDPFEFVASAPFTVGANASVHVRIPASVSLYSSLNVEVIDEHGATLSSTAFSTYQPNSVVLVDVSEPSRIREAVDAVPVMPGFVPSWMGGSGRGSGSAGPTLSVVSPRFEPATGDPLLPDRAALYAPADAVILRSDVLGRLAGDELDALAKFVLGGGTLAIAVARPEDLRHPTLIAFAGGAVTKGSPSAATLDELSLPVPATAGAAGAKPIPGARRPSPETTKALVGHTGGNLHGSAYGNSATYGLGEVHLLSFDPTQKPAMDDPWAHVRLVDLARRAHDRRVTVVFRSGGAVTGNDYTPLRKQLDPNENSLWAIAAAAILLCLYAVLAGPFNFARAKKNGAPLRALWHLPIYAAVGFALVMGIGGIAKGVRGRARHLTLVEAGAGMTEGSSRRFRAFYSAKNESLTVRTTDRSGVLATAIFDNGLRKDTLVIDRDGARLTDLAALPWETIVVREDGTTNLGEGISVLQEGADVAVKNRTGRALRGAILFVPGGKVSYLGAIADGEKKRSSAGKDPATIKGGDTVTWLAQIGTASKVGLVEARQLHGELLHELLDADAPGLADGWRAMESAAGGSIDWIPPDVPVLFAQIDGGEGRKSDAGLAIDRDRLLVRIVGFGGKP